MAAAGAAVEQDPAVRAVMILVSLRSRKLRRFPEWAPMPSGEASSSAVVVVGDVPEGWPKRPRSGNPRVRRQGHWKLASLKQEPAAATGSGACSSAEERESARVSRHAATAVNYDAPAGSSPSTSGDRAHPRPAGGKAAAAAAAAPKGAMEAPSPETPLDFGGGGGGAGSGASSSQDGSSSKRKGHGASSGEDEGCNSPAKRTRAAVVAAAEEKAASAEPNKQSEPSSNGRDESGKLAFDLNLPWSEEDGCLGTLG